MRDASSICRLLTGNALMELFIVKCSLWQHSHRLFRFRYSQILLSDLFDSDQLLT